MTSDSSARSLLSLFSSSNLTTFTPPASRNFYKTTPPANASSDDPTHDHDRPPRKKRRRHRQSSVWTCAEIRALESYRNLMKGDDDIDGRLRDVLLPNRTVKEVKLQLARVEETIRERRGGKLLELQEEENERFVAEEKERMIEMEKDYERRRRGMDNILGLAPEGNESTQGETDIGKGLSREGESKHARTSLDQQDLGLIEETVEQRRRRELDEALGLLS